MSNRTPHRVRSRTFDVPPTQGANALSYAPEPIPASRPESSSTKRRVTLSVVPSISTKRRIPLLITMLLMILASAVIVLLLNVFIANGQYTMVGLKGQERTLSQENEALRQEAQYLEAPQVIAEKATKLGMVKPGTPAAINLDTGQVTGKATAAVKPEKDSKISGVLATPLTPETEVPTATETKTEPNKPEAVEGSASATAPTQGNPVQTEEAPAPTVKQPLDSGTQGRPSFTPQQLNGGTIPAPTMKTPGR